MLLAFLCLAVAPELSSARKGQRASCMPPTPVLLRVGGPSFLLRVLCPSFLLRVLCLQENLRCTPQEQHPQGGQTWFLPLQTGDAEGSGQDTSRQDRVSACGMSGLEETHPEQRGRGPVFPPAPTPSVETEMGLWLEWVTGGGPWKH